MADLWPDEIGRERAQSPVAHLHAQGLFLEARCGHLLQSETPRLDAVRNSFTHAFDIVAPALDNYRYRLLTVSFGISLYPTRISVAPGVLDEIRGRVNVQPDSRDKGHKREVIVAESEEQFLDCLEVLFATIKIRQAIAMLMSQADPLWDQP
jgi:hypothetical protein